MSWHEISITGPKAEVDTVTSALEEQGALAVTYKDGEDNPIFEPSPQEVNLWDKVVTTGLFPIDCDLEKITLYLNKICPTCFISYQPLVDKNWTTAWLEHFKPQKFGNSLWVCPTQSLEAPDASFEGTIVALDPGLAFGTGQHPTTKLCLEWLASNKLDDKAIIDFGCGTSILAISALKLGAMIAYGIDHDDQAILSSQMNAEKNALNADQLKLYTSVDSAIPACELIVANILMNPLLSLAPILADLCLPGGTILLSGLLETQADGILDCYQTWFDFKPYCVDNGWILLVGTKRPQIA
ncbi:MAG: 50S ribosomal protein L11 methyltransferase [Candidatus Berkiella sp.]